MPSKRKPCPTCRKLMDPRSEQCRRCKPSYLRTPEHNQKMSLALSGIPKPHLRGRKRPEHSAAMKDWWTDERRQQKREQMLLRNPASRYHGLSAKSAARIVREAGRCEHCGGDGSESRLSVHHRNRDKRDQHPKNHQVLCHRCHMQEHAKAGETGWQIYHRKRMMIQD